jgi:hypothetical protein
LGKIFCEISLVERCSSDGLPKKLAFDSRQQLRWIGKLIINGIFDGEHVFLIRDNNDGTSTFIQFEQFKGILIPFMKKMLDKDTLKGFNQMNETIKKRCESLVNKT